MTIAKGLGAGFMPIGAMLCSAGIHDAIAAGSGSFQHGHTYHGHPLAAAGARVVLPLDEAVLEDDRRAPARRRALQAAHRIDVEARRSVAPAQDHRAGERCGAVVERGGVQHHQLAPGSDPARVSPLEEMRRRAPDFLLGGEDDHALEAELRRDAKRRGGDRVVELTRDIARLAAVERAGEGERGPRLQRRHLPQVQGQPPLTVQRRAGDVAIGDAPAGSAIIGEHFRASVAFGDRFGELGAGRGGVAILCVLHRVGGVDRRAVLGRHRAMAVHMSKKDRPRRIVQAHHAKISRPLDRRAQRFEIAREVIEIRGFVPDHAGEVEILVRLGENAREQRRVGGQAHSFSTNTVPAE
ncbi:MAG: aminotransferase class III-fold pyridoxal phosphate-dependent enzyme [Oceanicaulis sp.]